MKSCQRIFCTDCEGPISKNDNALELTAHFVPDGDAFFAKISRYDDYLAEVAKKPGYKAGDTLKLILPFLRAYGATNRSIEAYCMQNVILMPAAQWTLQHISSLMAAYIISTSYRPYISSLCKVLNFPEQQTFSTEINIDKYELSETEIERLREFREEIASLPPLRLPPEVKRFEELPTESQRTIRRLDQIFWEEIPAMESGKMLAEVNPVGGKEKALAIMDILRQQKGKLQDVLYVGDSITDVDAFQIVRKGGGVSVCFNGNRYALAAAEIACLAEDTTLLAVLAELFCQGGKEKILTSIADWSPSRLPQLKVSQSLQRKLSENVTFPEVEIISQENREELIEKSERFRKAIRGERVGELG